MRRYFNILSLVLAILSFSACGVKKNATAEVSSAKATQPATTEQAETAMDIATPKQAETAMDTLPDFLKEFANDSTIHINWAYGIPFIIDDSVPMFLPPIDKNPEGYVSHQAKDGYEYYSIHKDDSIYCISSPIDSLLWLNKCIYDWPAYSKLPNTDIEPTHFYGGCINLLTDNNNTCFIFIVLEQSYDYCYWHKDYLKALDTKVCYYFDLDGNLLGKMHQKIPTMVDLSGPSLKSIQLRKTIPNHKLFQAEYFGKTTRCLCLQLKVMRPNTEYCHEGVDIK